MCHAVELLAKARIDRSGYLGQLLELYANYLRVLAASNIGRRLRARVSPSDVVQETFFEAHRDFAKFNGHTEREFMAWLRRILVNNLARLVERHLQADKRDVRREVSLQAVRKSVERSTMRLESVIADRRMASPSSLCIRQERAVLLANELAALPDDYRDVLVLRNLEGLSFGEVADRMGRSAGAVRMLWLRALENLRQNLETNRLI